MLNLIRNNLPISNDKGFTLLELLVCMLIFFIMMGCIFIVIPFGDPSYDGKAYTDKGGIRYYHMVCLPDEGKIGGVCAGIGYKFSISPEVPRLCFIALTCMGGVGIPIYIFTYLMMDSAHTPQDFLERTGG